MSYSSDSRREGSYISHSSVGFHRIVYSDWGPEQGPVVVCVAGLTGNGHDFDWLAHELAQEGYRVIAVDLPGRGRSDYLQNSSDYVYTQYMNDLVALLAALNIKEPRSIDWIGVSLGGLLGIRLAALENSPIRRMIINDIGPEVPQAALDFIAGYLSQEYRFKTLDEMEAFMRQTRGLTWGPITDEQWHAMAENNARALPDGSLTYSFDPKIADMFNDEPIGDLNFWPLWDQLNQKILVLRGADSTLLLEKTAHEMLERGPGSSGSVQLETIPDCGHVPSLMAPDQIALVKTWLRVN